jgi:hypothetical protein
MTTSPEPSTHIPLREIAFSRSGDKGDIANVNVIPYDAKDWDLIREHVTVAAVTEIFAGIVTGPIVRYELPGTHALNFVMHGALNGGIASSLRVDGHGKSLQSLILEVPITRS